MMNVVISRCDTCDDLFGGTCKNELAVVIAGSNYCPS